MTLEREALVLGGALAALWFLDRLLEGPRRNPARRRRRRRSSTLPNPWRMMRGHRVHIDDEGRIDAGELPRDWQGTHVRDVAELGRRWRVIDDEEEACTVGAGARLPSTFRSQDEAVAELYAANPQLLDFVQSEAKGASERAYQAWVRRGRRGPKPTLARGDGRFDALNEGLERKGKRAVASWSEAVRAVVPSSRRWADFADRLPYLEDATGLDLNLPEPAEALAQAGERGGECEQLGDGARGRLLEEAEAGLVPLAIVVVGRAPSDLPPGAHELAAAGAPGPHRADAHVSAFR